MKTGVIFDLDGTLLDTLGDLTDSVNYALRVHGHPLRSTGEVRAFVGNGAQVLIRLSTGNAPDTNAVFETFRNHYNAHCRIKTAPYPGILDALAEISRRYPVAIVSNKPDSAVKPLCQEYFPGIYALGEHSGCPRKPAPDMVLQAMADIGVDRCVYVGDSEVDILTAGNAGVPCLSVLWGFRDKQELTRAGGVHFCENTNTLTDKIEELIHGK